MGPQKTINSQNYLEQQEKSGMHYPTLGEIYYKATVVKIA